MVTKDSVEEDILERAKAKMVLDALVVQGLNSSSGDGTGSSVFSAQKPASGFSREELAKILKFGATKLWNDDGSKTSEGMDIDLDRVLAEAEPAQSDGLGGRAGDLLSSYSNVTDFR